MSDQRHQFWTLCRRLSLLIAVCGAVFCFLPVSAAAAEYNSHSSVRRVLFLQDAHTRIVLLGTMLLGVCGGLVGVFMLLRKRALIGDVVGHSALPGIAIAFIVCEVIAPGTGKSLPALITGAFLSGLAGALCVMLIDRYSPLRADAAMAITLSLFYGLGAALLTVIQRMPTAASAGLNSYLYGKTASIVTSDVWVFGGAAVFLIGLILLLFKEFSLLCFDEDYASSCGWPVKVLDALLTCMVVAVTIIGMQTVGLILVVAILIIPAASARFWTDDLRYLMAISALLGAISGAGGTILSALAPKLAAGPVIVLCGSALFLVSMVLGTGHGLFWMWLDQRQLRKQTGRHDLLRAFYERVESTTEQPGVSDLDLLNARLTGDELLRMRAWKRSELQSGLRLAIRSHYVEEKSAGRYQLTPDGAALARRAVRNHRLWELYLITYADAAPANADYDADRIEHVLGADLVRELELRLLQKSGETLPASPHQLPQ
ncbi:metal ABC transporter permease [Planctomicrobium sp. SH527]|uniref:metal ABC transporter permease n=1 Tax=Planctomicrobium sp. SH527 TaxID=3448123 RepID=UPI003F5C83D7